jgi:hypothetical protein
MKTYTRAPKSPSEYFNLDDDNGKIYLKLGNTSEFDAI